MVETVHGPRPPVPPPPGNDIPPVPPPPSPELRPATRPNMPPVGVSSPRPVLEPNTVSMFGARSLGFLTRGEMFFLGFPLIGIRLAMGAKAGDVLKMVILEAGWMVGIGVVIGVALGLAAAKAASTLLFGLRPTDPATLASAMALLISIGLLASYLPARRASKLDPVTTLRQE